MNEREFLQKLQARAKEQEAIMHHMSFPRLFGLISLWLGKHPWRLLIPLSFVISFFAQLVWGKHYDDVILQLFGGLGIIKL